jgi:hypothetical protein
MTPRQQTELIKRVKAVAKQALALATAADNLAAVMLASIPTP